MDAIGQTQSISVRKPKLAFEREIERFYLERNSVKTHFFNALNLAFPDGERFFVKSVQDHRAQITDPALLADMRAFSSQEGQHANQHERFFVVLERQGYDVSALLRRFRVLARWASRTLPRGLRLSITAGAEHYTATMASAVLEHEMLSDCDPTLKQLIEWHALEEIEHKHVAYDVLATLYPSNYPLRILGFAIATAFIGGWTLIGMRALLRQDGRAGRLSRAQYRADRRGLGTPKVARFRRAVRKTLLQYLRPGFHPNQQDDTPLLMQFRPLIDARM